MTAATFRSWLGIAKEATKGTPVTATDFIPAKTITPVDDYAFLKDQDMRGSLVDNYGEIPGTIKSNFTFGGDVMTGFGYPLFGILGDYATTGASAPYSHTGSVLNTGNGQPTGYTLTDYDNLAARQFAGMQFTEVQIKASADGLLEYTAKAEGFASAVQGSPPSPSYDSVPPIANWRGQLLIGGSSVPYAPDLEMTIKRSVQVVHTIQNIQQPFVVFVGALEVSGKLTFVAQDESQFLNMVNNTQPSLDITWAQGSGATLSSLNLHCSKAAYTKATKTRGKEYMEISAEFEAVGNTTDVGASAGYSPIKATFQNAKVAGTFA